MKSLRLNFVLSEEEEETHSSNPPKNGCDQSNNHFIKDNQEIDFCEKFDGDFSVMSEHSADKNHLTR